MPLCFIHNAYSCECKFTINYFVIRRSIGRSKTSALHIQGHFVHQIVINWMIKGKSRIPLFSSLLLLLLQYSSESWSSFFKMMQHRIIRRWHRSAIVQYGLWNLGHDSISTGQEKYVSKFRLQKRRRKKLSVLYTYLCPNAPMHLWYLILYHIAYCSCAALHIYHVSTDSRNGGRKAATKEKSCWQLELQQSNLYTVNVPAKCCTYS